MAMWAKRWLWATAIMQVCFLGSLLLDLENTRNTGTVYRLELDVYDPYDYFRGNFMALQFKEDRVKMPAFQPRWDEKFYVQLKTDPKTGFARAVRVSKEFKGGDDWIQVRNSGGSVMEDSDTLLLFSFMQDRFFMHEDKAKKAEEALRKATADSNRRCWAEMRLRKGTAILTDVKIDGKSLKELTD